MFILFLILLFLAILFKIWAFFAEQGTEGTVIGSIFCGAILIGAIHAYLCTNVSWYGSPVVAPEISMKLEQESWGDGTELEPLLGEEIVEGEDGNHYVTLTDHCIDYKSHCGNTPDVVIEVTPEAACECYDQTHPGHTARNDIKSCHERAESYDKKVKEQRQTEENHHKSYQNGSSNSSSSSSNSQPNHATGTCQHYESGRCWDDLGMEAYSQGQYDKLYGSHGDSYYDSDDCDAVCSDILEDAYEEGYSDY